jgi:RimJ/RimL family protein N-acetyltransferase
LLARRDARVQGDRRMKVLETERMTLRWLTLEDAPFLLELMNDPAFIQNVADRGLRTTTDAANYIAEKMLPSYEQFGFGMNVAELKETGMPIGTCGLFKRETMDHVDIGYAFLRQFWRQGFAYEAAAAVIVHGRETLHIPKIVGMTAPGNESSIKLLEKLGLRFERMIQMPGYEGESKLFA